MSIDSNAHTHATNGASNGHSHPARVVITGVGAITPLGLSNAATWENLLAGRSGIGPITRFDTSDLRTNFAGEVRDFDPSNYMDRKEARRLDPYIQYALAATKEALEDSRIDLDAVERNRIGCIVGSGIGGVQATTEGYEISTSKGLRRVSPFMVPNMLVDSAAGKIAIEHNLHGINHAVVSAC